MPRRLLYLHGTHWGVFAVPLVPGDRFAPLPQGWLPFRGKLHVGPYRLTWEWRPDPGGAANPREDLDRPNLVGRGSLECPRELDILVDARPYGNCELTRRLTLVGRKPPCHLIFTSRSISSCHFLIVAEGDRVWVVDLASGNSTLIDGRAVVAEAWPAGSSVTVGRVTLVLRAICQTTGIEGENLEAVERSVIPFGSSPLSPDESGERSGDSEPTVADDSAPLGEAIPRDSVAEPEGDMGPLPTSGEHPTPIALEQEEAKIWGFAEGSLPAGSSGVISPGEWVVPGEPVGQAISLPREDVGEDSRHRAEKTAGKEGPTFGQAVGGDGSYTEILVEESMQDDRGAALAKDFVLSLFASGSVDVSPSCEDAAPQNPTGGEEIPGRLVGVSEKMVVAHDATSFGEVEQLSLEAKKRELACKEQLLSEWARSLDEMSETLLRLQEELVAEEDRFAEEKERLLGEAKRLEAAWQDYHVARENLDRRETQLAEREKALAEQVAGIEARERALQERLSQLAAWERRLKTWEDDLRLRQEELSQAKAQSSGLPVAGEAFAPKEAPSTPERAKDEKGSAVTASAEGRWALSGLPPPHRRWRVPREILVGGALAIIAAFCVWMYCPRFYATLHRLSLFEVPWLVAVRDGQCPAEVPPEIFTVNAAFWPDSPQVLQSIQQDSQIHRLPLIKKKGLKWLLDTVKIGRTEGLPYVTWYLVCTDRASSRRALERWREIYWTELVATVRRSAQSALLQCEEKGKEIGRQLDPLKHRLEELVGALGTSDPRLVELEVRKNLQSAELAEKELAQLDGEMDLHRKKLSEIQAILRDPVSFVTPDELNEAVSRRLAEGAVSSAETPGAALPDRPEESRPDAASQNAASTAELPKAPVLNPDALPSSPEAKLEVLREIAKRELAAAKKEEASLLAQTLSTELERLQTRRDRLQAQIAEFRTAATRLTQQADEIRQIGVKLAQLEREAARWDAAAETLKKMLRELDNPPHQETVQSVRGPYLPAALAFLTAGLVLGSAVVIRAIRQRRSQRRLVIHWIDGDNGTQPPTG